MRRDGRTNGGLTGHSSRRASTINQNQVIAGDPPSRPTPPARATGGAGFSEWEIGKKQRGRWTSLWYSLPPPPSPPPSSKLPTAFGTGGWKYFLLLSHINQAPSVCIHSQARECVHNSPSSAAPLNLPEPWHTSPVSDECQVFRCAAGAVDYGARRLC